MFASDDDIPKSVTVQIGLLASPSLFSAGRNDGFAPLSRRTKSRKTERGTKSRERRFVIVAKPIIFAEVLYSIRTRKMSWLRMR